MKFSSAKLSGVYVIEMEPQADERGHFVRTFCAEEFARHSLVTQFVQCSSSFNLRRGTLRGLHYQVAPHEEAKLVRCSRGRIFDVVVDIRPESPTYKRWLGVELSDANRLMLYVPRGFAHGFQTLEDRCEVFYQISHPYVASSARGIRWDDPAVGIEWPSTPQRILSPRDEAFPPIRD